MPNAQPLEESIDQLWEQALDLGLDPHPVIFEQVPSARLYDIAAYGMPSHYRHWSYGKRFHEMKKQYDRGQGRIMELVVNSNPALAYLLKNNHRVYNKMVCAHVFAHSDFFKHNMYFAPTNEDKVPVFRAHQERMAQYEDEHGLDAVEQLLDYAHALRLQRPITPRIALGEVRSSGDSGAEPASDKPIFEEYQALFPERSSSSGGGDEDEEDIEGSLRKDLLLFLIEESETLEDWQRDVLSMVHDEQTFLLPQIVTKTMNEGWAVFWHTRLMKELRLTEQENLLYAKVQGQVTSRQPLSVNPYLVGWKIFEEIEERHGLETCFEVRNKHSDASFYREYLTDELIETLDLYSFRWVFKRDRPEKARVHSTDPEEVRTSMANLAAHNNIPQVHVKRVKEDGSLVLEYREERELYEEDARRVLHYIEQLWGQDVYLQLQGGETLRPSSGGEADE